jgi:hypothetical protein
VADVFARSQRCYPQIQSAFDSIPNTGGTATVANSDCCLVTTLTTEASQAEIVRPDKTGSLDEIVAQAGRRIGKFSAGMSAAGNGGAGVAPDCKNFLQGIIGAAGTIAAGVSVTYSLADALFYLAIYNFMSGIGNATQMCAFNALIQKMEATFGGDVPMLTFSGECSWTGDNDQAADSTHTPAESLGGLTTWPAEPSAPVVNGTFPPGFKVTAVIDGNSYTNILSGKVALDVMRELLKDGNTEFPGAGVPGPRTVLLDWTMADNDSSSLRGLKQKAFSRTPVNAVFTVGTVAGNRWVHTANNIIVPKPVYADQGIRRVVSFTGAHAYPSAITARDHYTLGIT